MSQKKSRRPRFVPQMVLKSTAFVGLAVVPAITADCGSTAAFGVGTGYVAAAFLDSGTDAQSSDAATDTGLWIGVAAIFDAGVYSVGASFDAGPDATDASVDVATDASADAATDSGDSGLEPDAPAFAVAATFAPKEGDDGNGRG